MAARRASLAKLPARTIFIFFVTLLGVGLIRRGDLAALWVLAWLAFGVFKVLVSVKRKVEAGQGIKT